THTERTVVLEIFLLPGKGGLAAHGKERDVPVGGIHIMLHPVDAFHFRLYPEYPAALIQQGGGHVSYDRHQYHVSENDFMLNIHFSGLSFGLSYLLFFRQSYH